jgi:hypothetical protein
MYDQEIKRDILATDMHMALFKLYKVKEKFTIPTKFPKTSA